MSLLEDARNIQRKDPAARSVLEVILLYPGFHILVYHRIAHWLYEHGHFFLARWVSQHGRHKTGIEIHPGAQIGRCLFIDHGMGIVFGETTVIGDNCTIYTRDAGRHRQGHRQAPPHPGQQCADRRGHQGAGPVYIAITPASAQAALCCATCPPTAPPWRARRGGAHQQQGRQPRRRPGPAGSAGCHGPAPHRAGPPHQQAGKGRTGGCAPQHPRGHPETAALNLSVPLCVPAFLIGEPLAWRYYPQKLHKASTKRKQLRSAHTERSCFSVIYKEFQPVL